MTNWPDDFELSYNFAGTSADFISAKAKPPSFGIAVQLELCTVINNVYFLASDQFDSGHQYLLKFEGGVWALVADGTDLLPSGILNTAVGGYAQKLGDSFWASLPMGGGNNINAWRSDDGGITWAIKLSYLDTVDFPHGLPITYSAGGTLWAARRNSGTTDFEIVSSIDNGENWTVSYSPVSDPLIYHAASHPTDSNIIAFAGISEPNFKTTIFATIDGGSSWTETQFNDAEGSFTDSTALLFVDNGDLIYAAYDAEAFPVETFRMYKLSSPYTSASEQELINEDPTPNGPFDGPFMALSRNPQFTAINWPSGGVPHARIWRSEDNGDSWTELAEPFAADIYVFGICYIDTTLYAVGYVNIGGAMAFAKADNAGSGSITWTDITSDVNTAAGVTLQVLAAQMIFEAP